MELVTRDEGDRFRIQPTGNPAGWSGWTPQVAKRGQSDPSKEIQKTWTTSAPERIGEKAVKFLGMDIKKIKAEEKEAEVWCISQESYLRDLLAKDGNET